MFMFSGLPCCSNPAQDHPVVAVQSNVDRGDTTELYCGLGVYLPQYETRSTPASSLSVVAGKCYMAGIVPIMCT